MKRFLMVLTASVVMAMGGGGVASAYTQAARQAGQKAITDACMLRTGCHNITTHAAQEGNGATTFYFYYWTTYCGKMQGQVWVRSDGLVLQFIAQSVGCITYYDRL